MLLIELAMQRTLAPRDDLPLKAAGTRTPLPLFAGEVGERSETGEGFAYCTTLTRVASAPRPLPRKAVEVYTLQSA